METKEYVEYLLKNYNEILKDIEQLKFEYDTFKDIETDEVIESLNFSSNSEERIQTSSISDKTCKIALIYNEAAKRMNKESREEIYKMIRVTRIEISRLDYCIDRLEPQVKEVIIKMYQQKENISNIVENLSIGERTVCRYKKKGIEDIINMYELKRLVI